MLHFYSLLFVVLESKYYDDCAQILSEHILALLKPSALKTISTLDPLVTTNNNLGDVIEKPETFLSRAARILQGDPDAEEEEEADNRSFTSLKNNAETSLSPGRETGDLLNNAAATLLNEG